MDPESSADAKRAQRAWILYDVGNSAFATTVMAVVLPVYFASVAGSELADGRPTALWGFATTVAMLLSAVTAPVMGALADARARRRHWLGLFALAGAVLTTGFALVGPGDWVLALALYIAARLAFANSVVMYDSLLPHVAAPEDMDAVSARGFGFGYLGGGLLLALQLVVITKPSLVGIPEGTWATRLVFASTGVWWALFTIPILRAVRERVGEDFGASVAGAVSPVREAFSRLARTFHELRRHRQAMTFLVAFWLYNDGIGTIVSMAAIFAEEIGLERTQTMIALLVVQFLGFPFSLLFGRLARSIGARNAIAVGLVGYTLICIGAWFVRTEAHFFALAVGVSMFQGGCQALSRSLFASMIPAERSSEFFGFYNISSKFASLLGPLILSTIALITGDARMGVIALVVLFLGGLTVLLRVHPEQART